jgi:hypothetical protein
MLEDLDKVNWSQLSHAYGAASDVPELLRDLASPDATIREKTHAVLYSNIYHQGTIYEATAYVVPFLLELLQTPQVADKEWLLNYLVSLANHNFYWDVHQHLSFRDDNYPDQRELDEFQAALMDERSWVGAANRAVRDGIPLYLELAEQHPAPTVRMAALYTLSSLSSHSVLSEVTPRLLAHLTGATADSTREPYQQVRASLIYSLGYLFAPLQKLLSGQPATATPDEPTASKLEQLRAELQPPLANYQIYLELLKTSLASAPLKPGEQPESKLVQLVAAVNLTRWLGDQAPAQAINLLVVTLVASNTTRDELAKQYNQLPWVDKDMADDLAGSLCQLQPELAAQVAIPTLCNALQLTDNLPIVIIIAALLYMAFNPQREMGVVSWETLNLSQKQVLEALASSQTAWRSNRYLSALLKDYRLPTNQADLQLFMQGAS